MKKIIIFTIYPEKGASSNFRILQYVEDLMEKYEVMCYSFWNEDYVTKYIFNKKKYKYKIFLQYLKSCFLRIYQLIMIAPKSDLIFMQKASVPKFPFTFLGTVKKKGTKVIFDVDDAIYLYSQDNSPRIARQADLVICGNNELLQYYQKYNQNCIVVPTVDNTLKYEQCRKDSFNNKIIGWIGSKTTIDNLDLVVSAINMIVDEHPEVSFHIISNTSMDYTERINNSKLIKWDKDTYIEELSKVSVGIMPLKDNEVNKGKCGFKLIQYMNAGIPFIASDVGVNKEYTNNNGIIASNAEEWKCSLEQLLFDEPLYRKLQNHVFLELKEKYHYKTVLNKLELLFEQLIS